MASNLFQTANILIDKLENKGFEAYIVGGAVRDHLLSKEVYDIDITTSAHPRDIKAIFPKTIDVALKHGTVIVCFMGETYEVTSYRAPTLSEDLKLRDFTINAIALQNNGKMVDPYFGQDDLKRKLIRGVVNPTERFKEDPLRILRAFRFVSQLGFTIEEKTFLAITNQKQNIAKVAIERIAAEFRRLCLGVNSEKSLQLLMKSQLPNEISQFNEIHHCLMEQKVLKAIPALTDMTEVWSLLLYYAKVNNCETFLRTWKQPKKVIDDVKMITSRLPILLTRGFSEEDLYFLGIEKAKKAERVRAVLKNDAQPNIEEIMRDYERLSIKNKKDLAINGKDIICLLKDAEGRERVGQLISIVEKAVLSRHVENNKKEIIRWLRKEGYVNA